MVENSDGQLMLGELMHQIISNQMIIILTKTQLELTHSKIMEASFSIFDGDWRFHNFWVDEFHLSFCRDNNHQRFGASTRPT